MTLITLSPPNPSNYTHSHRVHSMLPGFYLYPPNRGKISGSVGKLILGPYQGRPACLSITPIAGKGVCADAFTSGRGLVVRDVSTYPGHIGEFRVWFGSKAFSPLSAVYNFTFLRFGLQCFPSSAPVSYSCSRQSSVIQYLSCKPRVPVCLEYGPRFAPCLPYYLSARTTYPTLFSTQ
jgi:hypothetical protein